MRPTNSRRRRMKERDSIWIKSQLKFNVDTLVLVQLRKRGEIMVQEIFIDPCNGMNRSVTVPLWNSASVLHIPQSAAKNLYREFSYSWSTFRNCSSKPTEKKCPQIPPITHAQKQHKSKTPFFFNPLLQKFEGSSANYRPKSDTVAMTTQIQLPNSSTPLKAIKRSYHPPQPPPAQFR